MKKFDIYELIVLTGLLVLLVTVPFVMNEAELGSLSILGGRLVMVISIIAYIVYCLYPGKRLYSCPICDYDFEKAELVKKKIGFMTANRLCPFCIKEREVPCIPFYQKED